MKGQELSIAHPISNSKTVRPARQSDRCICPNAVVNSQLELSTWIRKDHPIEDNIIIKTH